MSLADQHRCGIVIWLVLLEADEMTIRRVKGGFRLFSKKKNPKTGKRRNLGTFKTKAEAQAAERRAKRFSK